MKHFSFTQLLRSSLLLWSLLLTAISLPATAQNWNQIIKLAASDAGRNNEFFGYSVAVSGDYAIVGAYGKNSARGAAYVFIRTGTTWTQQAILTATDGIAPDQFGYSVAISGDYAIVGANHTGTGAAYVFVRTGTSWTQQAKLIASDAAINDTFGYSVSISGDYVVVGSYQISTDLGAAYVFVRSGTTWSQQAKLSPSGAAREEGFGNSVSISGDYAIVGAAAENDNTGAAYVFARSGTTWSQQTKLSASDVAIGDSFGSSVAISGDYVIVGASDKNNLLGAAYVFVRTGTDWNQQAELTMSDGGAGDNIGSSVAISGGYAILGSPPSNNQTGFAYVYGNCTAAITGQPVASSAVCIGTTVTASVSTTGIVNSYQWYKGSTPVVSQTAITLSIPSATTADAGTYSVVVTGVACSFTSNAFSLTVNPPPSATILSPASTTLTCTTPR